MSFLKKKQFWGILVGLSFLAWCVKDIRVDDVEVLLTRLNPYYVIPSILCTFFYVALRALRWRILISQQGSISAWRSVTMYSAGQVLNYTMPMLTGQLGRLILFARKLSLRKTFVFSTIFLETVFDGLCLIIFMFFTSLAFALPSEYRKVGIIIAVVTVVAIGLLYLVLQSRERVESFMREHFRDRRPGLYVGTCKFVRSFSKGIMMLRSSQHLASTNGLSLVSWVAHMFAIWFLFKAFGFTLPIAIASVIMVINTIVLMIPIAPGNAGTFELAVSTSLTAFSIGRTDAILFALALHLVDLVPVFILGVVFLWQEKISIRQLRREHSEVTILDKISEEGTYVEEGQA
jgi:uncharacterized protein (TIRG00374 family)